MEKITNSYSTDFSCPRKIDSFTVSELNGNGDLDYPVGLLTGDENMMAGAKYATANNEFYLYASSNYGHRGMSPYYFYPNAAINSGTRYDGAIIDTANSSSTGVRPVISLKNGFSLIGEGDGIGNSPYVVDISGEDVVNVTFNANGGMVTPSTKKVFVGKIYGTLPSPSYDTNQFSGWYTEATGGTLVTDDTIVTVTGSQTLYAHWQINNEPT